MRTNTTSQIITVLSLKSVLNLWQQTPDVLGRRAVYSWEVIILKPQENLQP